MIDVLVRFLKDFLFVHAFNQCCPLKKDTPSENRMNKGIETT